MTPDEAAEYHSPQIAAMADAGADLVQAMTFGSVEEAVGVSWAARDAGLPVSVSFMLDSGLVPCGVTLREAVETTDSLAGAGAPDFFGINCSHPHEFLPSLDEGDWVRRVRVVRPNASSKEKVALCRIGHLEEGDPVELAGLMAGLAMRYPHIDIWGGCCGTWEVHLREMTVALAG
jgi:S-methylmethionine-dependent homocysteine/selenocysteine methylase